MVDNANESTQAGIEDNLTDAGYTYSETRNEYTKEVLEDVTAFGGQDYTNARVEGYNDYETPDELIDFSVKVNGKEGDELTKDDFAKMASSAIERKISYAMEELKNIRERIFGKPRKASEEKEYLIFEKEDAHMKKEKKSFLWFKWEKDEETTGTITRRILKKDGEFNKHVGYAPQLRNMPDNKKTSSLTEFKRENILFEGSGEMGTVMLQFMRYQMMEGRGWSEFAKPWDERRMFDDDAIPDALGFLKNWTVGGAVDLVANIALSATLGAFAPLIMLASDAVDMASELAQGRDLGEAIFDFGKDAFIAGVNVALSSVSFGGGETVKEAGKLVEKTGMNFSQFVSKATGGGWLGDGIGALASNVVSSQANNLANAVTYSAKDGWDFDTDGYLDSTFGVGAIASYAGSFAGAAVTTGLTGTLEGFSQTHAIDVKKTAQFFGNTATMGTQYLISGETSMNVLNFDMFGLKDIDGNTISRGLLEVKFGEEGITTAAGTGGVNMSYNAIKGAIEGFDTFATQQKIRYYEATGKTDFADDYTGTKKVGTSLRMNYSFGDGKQIGQLNSILDGTDTLRVGYIGQDGYTKKIGGGREVNLATLGTDSDINTRLKAGIVLGHEAYRDGVERTEKEQFYESVNATDAHTAMALRVAGDNTYGSDFITSDANLSADVFNYSKGAADFEQYVLDNYNWRGENWLFKLDGTIVDDGKKYFSREKINDNGNLVSEKIEDSDFEGSRSKALIEAIGFENAKSIISSNGELSIHDIPDDVLKKEFGMSKEELRMSGLGHIKITEDMVGSESYKTMFAEAFMKKTGNAWNTTTGKWENGKIEIPGLAKNESMAVVRNENGSYSFFTAGMNITRDSDAFEVWKDNVPSNSYEVNNSATVSFYKRDLFSGENQVYDTGFAWASVDKDSDEKITPSKHPSLYQEIHTYKGNTIVSEYFKMHLTSNNAYGVDTVGVFTDAEILSGEELNKGGWRKGHDREPRWLMHPFGWGAGSKGCMGPMSNDGVSGWTDPTTENTGAWKFNQMLDKLQDEWGIYNGYEFNVHMTGKLRP